MIEDADNSATYEQVNATAPAASSALKRTNGAVNERVAFLPSRSQKWRLCSPR